MDQSSLSRANRAFDIVEELSNLLNTGLSRRELTILVALVENGCNPEVQFPSELKAIAFNSPQIFMKIASRYGEMARKKET